jgi:hypothetical protein
MTASITSEADPPLAAFVAEDDISLAGDYDPVYFTEDFLVYGYSVAWEDDPDPVPVSVEDDPNYAGWGIFDIVLFDDLLFDTGSASIDDDPPPVAIMVEAEP